MIKFAVISFPGNNCETESVRAIKRAGMEAEEILWNDPDILNGSRCDEFAGYFIIGGFSYEDRGRSGIVAAQDPIMEVIKEEASKGKVVIGVCNGAQILVESGLIPGFDNNELAISLAWNEMKKGDEIVGTGFYNVWCYLKNTADKNRCAFNDFDGLLHIPIAHGEGRFVINDEVLKMLEINNQIVFKYCDEDGEINPDFPVTPNGATASIAGICNPEGNVMAIMPHPERDPIGYGQKIFESIRRWIENEGSFNCQPLGEYECKDNIRLAESFDFEIYMRLIITDNAERTIEEALIRKGYDIKLSRYEYFGVSLTANTDIKSAIDAIMRTGEIANFNKHLVYIKTKDGFFNYSLDNGLYSCDSKDFNDFVVASDQKDFVGQSKKSAINRHAGDIVRDIRYGVLWGFADGNKDIIESVIKSKILYNPHSMYIVKS